MKTPEEIKKGLFLCKRNHCSITCPYHGENCCYMKLHTDALDILHQLERERDAAVRDLDNKSHGCDKCKHHLASIKKTCDLPIEKRKPSFACWEWRGLQEE